MSKQNKLAKMSEEQKLIYFEQQRLAEEEAQRSKQELVSQFLKMKLEREETMTKANQDKLNNEWKEILKQTKSKELKKEIKILSQVFEWMMDMKESSIADVCKDLREAEEQFMMAKRSHLHNIDMLITFQRERVGKMEEDFEKQKNLLKDNFDREKGSLNGQHEDEINKMQNIIYALEGTIIDKEYVLKAEFQTNLDEIKNRNLEDVHTLRLKHDVMLESLMSLFRGSIIQYKEATEKRRKSFEELKRKDDLNTEEIERQRIKIQELEKQIAKVKGKLANNTKIWIGKNEEVDYEKSLLNGSLLKLKRSYKSNVKHEDDQLAMLLLVIKDTQDQMKGIIRQGEKLLKAAERCRKLESEREKIVPVEKKEWFSEEEKELYQNLMSSELTEPLTKLMYNYTELENFWKRYSKVFLEKTALEIEVADLNEKNKTLMKTVREKAFKNGKLNEKDLSLFSFSFNDNSSNNGL